MIKLLVCIALLSVALLSVHGNRLPRGGHGGHDRGRGSSSEEHHGPPHGYGNNCTLASQLCSNVSLAQQFVADIQALITTLQANGSFTAVLQTRANEITYIQNSNNTALLSSNCTGYFDNLENAKALDIQAAETQLQYQQIAAAQLFGIINSFIGSCGHHGYH